MLIWISYDIINYDLRKHSYVDMDDFNNNLHNDETESIHSMIHNGTVNINDYNNYGRAIIGDDDRIKANTNSSAMLGITFIYTKYSNDFNTKCSGNLISKNIILTAAHCVNRVYDDGTLENSKYITAYPGRNDGNMPTGFYEVTNLYLLKGWNRYEKADFRYDIALLRIAPDEDNKYPTDYGASTYGYGFYDNEELSNAKVIAFGYPGDHDDENETVDVMYEMRNGKISLDNMDYIRFNNLINDKDLITNRNYLNIDTTLMHTLDTISGSSGAGLLNGDGIIIGVNSQECAITDSNGNTNACVDDDGNQILNTATRFTRESYTAINKLTTLESIE